MQIYPAPLQQPPGLPRHLWYRDSFHQRKGNVLVLRNRQVCLLNARPQTSHAASNCNRPFLFSNGHPRA
jgi:hypothetical protein